MTTNGAFAQFTYGNTYPIATLPDDLFDDKPAGEKWAIRDVLFWNDCQGWWTESIAEYRRMLFGDDLGHARFWSPLPPDPMSREQILAERGMAICSKCNIAVDVGKEFSCT